MLIFFLVKDGVLIGGENLCAEGNIIFNHNVLKIYILRSSML